MKIAKCLFILIALTINLCYQSVNCQQFEFSGPEQPVVTLQHGRGRQSQDLMFSPEEYSQDINEQFNGNIPRQPETLESGRHLSDSAFSAISETLGALNTVGRYLVNMTRHESGSQNQNGNNDAPGEDIPSALLTISKNVLGKNVTNSIAPFVREAIPSITRPGRAPKPVASANSCTTPENRIGECEDLSNCPQLLLDLGNLRQSLCFKSLFVPGVCCPKEGAEENRPTLLTTQKPTRLTPRPPIPITTRATTTQAPLPPTTSRPQVVVTESFTNLLANGNDVGSGVQDVVNNNLIVDPNDCGQPETSSGRVVGGEEAPAGRWPWMAAIFLHGPKRTEFWCGGSLIGKKYVLTAAHCTRDSRQRPFSPRQFTVRLGDIDLKRDDEPSAPITYHVTEVRAHPRFSRVGFYNDIAILVLDANVRKSKYIIPLCLPPRGLVTSQERLAGQRATVVGWGTTYYGGKESTIQRQALLPIWRNEDCNQAYFQPITENFVCAGYSEGGVDACQGDSGGPLMMRWGARWTQIGVVSFGNKCGEPGYPGVYTRVSQYLKWIRDTTKES